MGYQINRVQHGEEPIDWKSMKTVGPGVREIRVETDGQGYRAIYIATLGEVIYVLHCFEKKTRKTPKRDIDLAKSRLSELMKEIRG